MVTSFWGWKTINFEGKVRARVPRRDFAVSSGITQQRTLEIRGILDPLHRFLKKTKENLEIGKQLDSTEKTLKYSAEAFSASLQYSASFTLASMRGFS